MWRKEYEQQEAEFKQKLETLQQEKDAAVVVWKKKDSNSAKEIKGVSMSFSSNLCIL